MSIFSKQKERLEKTFSSLSVYSGYYPEQRYFNIFNIA